MRKKIISTILVTAMIFSVTGCGNKDDNETTKNTKETTAITEEETTNKVAEVETGYLDTLESYEIDISSDWTVKVGNETFTILGDKWENGAYVNKGSKINCFGYFDTENYVITVNGDCTKATVYKKGTSTITADNETTVTNNSNNSNQNGNTSNNVSNNNNNSNGNSNAYTPRGNSGSSSNDNGGSNVHVVIGNPDYNSPTHGGVIQLIERYVGETKALSNGTRYITYCYITYVYEDGFKEVDKDKELYSDFSVITENYSDVANVRHIKIDFSYIDRLATSIAFRDEDFASKLNIDTDRGLVNVEEIYEVYIRKDNKKEFGNIEALRLDIEEDRIIKDLGIKNLSTDMEKVVEIVNYIYSTCSYGVGDKYEMLLGSHKGVCNDAANLLKDFMDKLGLENCYVDSNTINHAWNAVLIDGLWWYVDAVPYGSPSIYHQRDTVTFRTNLQYENVTDKKFKDDNLNEVPAPPINTKYNGLDVYYKTKEYKYR